MSASKKMKFASVSALNYASNASMCSIIRRSTCRDRTSALGNLTESGLTGLITSTLTREDGTTSSRQIQVAVKVTF